MTDSVSRILVIKLSAFGDLLHAVPIAHRLAEHFDCPVDWVTQPEYAELVGLHRNVERVLIYPRKGALKKMPAFVNVLREQQYDLAVDLQGLAKSGMVMGLARAKRKISCAVTREGAQLFGKERPPYGGGEHAMEVLRDTLRYLEIDPDPVVYPMNWPEVGDPGGSVPRIGIAPRSRWPGKDWPEERFISLGQRLVTEVGASLHVFGSPQDEEIGRRIAGAVGDQAVSQCGRYTLPELGAALQQMDCMICNDSGPMHLSTAVGTQLVALFGPTDPAKTGPWGEGPVVLRPEPGPEGYPDHRAYKTMDNAFIGQITEEEVFEAVARLLTPA
jgi:heptosyltransferase-1